MTTVAGRLEVILILSTACLAAVSAAGRAGELPAGPPPEADGSLTLFLAGDAIIVRPWSTDPTPQFLALIDTIRASDVALVNLELVLHDFSGYGQADHGGMHLSARPVIARELAWAGVDMLSGANNHAFDYGSTGVLDTMASVAAADLLVAGIGRDLQQARAPAYFAHPDGSVALVSTAATFVPYGKASRTRPDLHGRPGLNPLTTVKQLELPAPLARALWVGAGLVGLRRERLDDDAFVVLDQRIQGQDGFGLRKGRWIDPGDLKENLAAVRRATAQADLVVFAIHAHVQGPWLSALARQVIDAGADVFIAHGPHAVLGVELYQGRPIIYGPGDLVFQPHLVERFPDEAYAEHGLADEAGIDEVRARMMGPGKRLFEQRAAWEGFGALLRFTAGELDEFRLVPMDLGFDRPLPERGRPQLAGAALGRRIVAEVIEQSRAYGTTVRYLEALNQGEIDLGQERPRPSVPDDGLIATR